MAPIVPAGALIDACGPALSVQEVEVAGRFTAHRDTTTIIALAGASAAILPQADSVLRRERRPLPGKLAPVVLHEPGRTIRAESMAYAAHTLPGPDAHVSPAPSAANDNGLTILTIGQGPC
jgi:hypothetical protein